MPDEPTAARKASGDIAPDLAEITIAAMSCRFTSKKRSRTASQRTKSSR